MFLATNSDYTYTNVSEEGKWGGRETKNILFYFIFIFIFLNPTNSG